MGNSWNQVRPIIGRPNRTNQFFYDLYQEEVAIDRHRSKTEIHDIGTAVTNMVENILGNAFENDPIINIPRKTLGKHVVGVGSFFEQTKVKDIDEFDFTFVLPYFSEDNVRVVKELHSPLHTCKHGVGKDPFAYVELEYFGPHKDTLMKKTLLTNINAKRYLVACRLFAVAKEMVDKSLSVRTNTLPIFRETGTLEFNSNHFGNKSHVNGPAMMLNFRWRQNFGENNLDIAVDLVPAIKASIPKQMFNYITAPGVMKKEMDDATCCLLIPKNGPNVSVDFMLSFSHVETKLFNIIRLEKPQWFFCYNLLKFIFWNDVKFTKFSTTHMFSSYILKTILIQEALICQEKCVSLVECLIKTLISLQRYTDSTVKGPGTHIEVRSAWFLDSAIACRSLKDKYEKQELLIVHECLENIMNVLINIDRCEKYEYEYHKTEFLHVVKLLNTSLFDLNEKRKLIHAPQSGEVNKSE